jgi:hypothetical protein
MPTGGPEHTPRLLRPAARRLHGPAKLRHLVPAAPRAHARAAGSGRGGVEERDGPAREATWGVRVERLMGVEYGVSMPSACRRVWRQHGVSMASAWRQCGVEYGGVLDQGRG